MHIILIFYHLATSPHSYLFSDLALPNHNCIHQWELLYHNCINENLQLSFLTRMFWTAHVVVLNTLTQSCKVCSGPVTTNMLRGPFSSCQNVTASVMQLNRQQHVTMGQQSLGCSLFSAIMSLEFDQRAVEAAEGIVLTPVSN